MFSFFLFLFSFFVCSLLKNIKCRSFTNTSARAFGGNLLEPRERESNGVVISALEKGSGLRTANASAFGVGFGSDVRAVAQLSAAISRNHSYFFTVFVTPGCTASFHGIAVSVPQRIGFFFFFYIFLQPFAYVNGANGPRAGAWHYALGENPTLFVALSTHSYELGGRAETSFESWRDERALQNIVGGEFLKRQIFRCLINFWSSRSCNI